MKAWVIAVIVIVVALVIAIVVQFVVRRVQRNKARKRVLQDAEAADIKKNTIFVTLVSNNNAAGAGDTLHQLFLRAKAPLRVYVGLCEFYESDASARAVDIYEADVKHSAAPFCLKDHVRVLRLPVSEARGMLAAQEQLERHLYCGETFVFTVQCPCVVAQDWDATLIDWLQGERSTVLTCQPSCTGGAPEGTTAPGTYMAVSHVHTWLPTFTSYAMKVRVRELVPAVAWSSQMSFSYGDRLRVAQLPRGVAGSAALLDAYVTGTLLAANWTIAHPPGDVVHVTSSSSIDTANIDDVLGVVVPLLQPVIAWVFASCGITNNGTQVTARGRMGLSVNRPPHEITAKLGSMSEYLSALSRIELSQTAAPALAPTPTTPTPTTPTPTTPTPVPATPASAPATPTYTPALPEQTVRFPVFAPAAAGPRLRIKPTPVPEIVPQPPQPRLPLPGPPPQRRVRFHENYDVNTLPFVGETEQHDSDNIPEI